MSGETNPEDRTMTAWKAMPWLSGGMAAIMLHDPTDRKARDQAGALLRSLAADPGNGIAQVLNHAQMQERGGFPEAAFVVVFQAGYYAGDEESGPLITAIPDSHGGHGFSPAFPEMRSAFFASGPGIAAHRDLGQINMLQIAPTLARILKAPLPAAKATPLPIQP